MKLKKLVAVITVVGALSAGGVVFADTLTTPAEIAASLTGKTIEEVVQERTTGKTYGTIANEAGKLDEFKALTLEQKKAILTQKVADKKLSQEQADKIIDDIQNNQEVCDGTGSTQKGKNNGAGFGRRNAAGVGLNNVRGMGLGRTRY
jgi:hypothetical protein